MRSHSQTLDHAERKAREFNGQSLEGFQKEARLRPLCCLGSPRFCLMVKKGYRDPPYHNWMHAFSVSHFCYLLYKNLELSSYLE